MSNALPLALMLALLAGVTVPAARADSDQASQLSTSLTADAPKQCPRLNNRYGYYANPWCTEAEQRAWDIWEARAFRRAAGK